MNITFLFNVDLLSSKGNYWFLTLEQLLQLNILQKNNRRMRVSAGDVLTFTSFFPDRRLTVEEEIRFYKKVYEPEKFRKLFEKRLGTTHGKTRVFCILIENMTMDIARGLHGGLISYVGYLGAMDVNFSKPFQLKFFRNSLPHQFRLCGKNCSIFYSAINDDPDCAEREVLEKNGYQVVYEDSGLRQTIFDEYDNLKHFERIEDFKKVFSRFRYLKEDKISDLILSLEELHPKLFNAFASAARTLERAETEEDLAQVALSGRRLLVNLANYLYPPTKQSIGGYKLGEAEYKNRLWAYIEKASNAAGLSDPNILQELGGETDRLVKLFNAGLHADLQIHKVRGAFRDLIIWLGDVIDISPITAQRPYLAYEEKVKTFLKGALGVRKTKKKRRSKSIGSEE